MRHDAHGHWIAEAGLPAAQPPLREDAEADVVVVGGGFTGLWAAWHVLEADPGARIVLLEADRVCGLGPSGRNGGFVNSLWLSLPGLRARFGGERAEALARASRDSVGAIGRWCEAEGIDAWYRAAAHPVLSTSPAQDGVGLDAVDGDEVTAIDAVGARAICDSPVFRGGVLVRTAATVQPARLAFGLRERLLARGVRIHEGTRVRGMEGTTAVTGDGTRVRGAAAILALGASTSALSPFRRRVTVASSHLVITEPVPDVLATLGWTGGEAISDGRTLLHYFRTTPDGRVAFGWAGGRIAAGARPQGQMEVDARVVVEIRRQMLRVFPALAQVRVDHAWGGPIDVSPAHIPAIVPLAGGGAWAAYGFTGNGVGPSHLAGRSLAALALGGDDEAARLAWVGPPPGPALPPEPLRVAGAAVVRRAIVAKEAAGDEGRRAGLLPRAVAGLPARLGLHLVR